MRKNMVMGSQYDLRMELRPDSVASLLGVGCVEWLWLVYSEWTGTVGGSFAAAPLVDFSLGGLTF